MKIIIDAREAVRNPTGIGNVGRKFVDFIVKRYKGNDEYFIFPNPDKWNKGKKKKGLKLFNFIFHICWKQIYIPLKAFVLKADVILGLGPEAYFLTTKPTAIIIYDMIFFKIPVKHTGGWGRYWKVVVPLSVKKAKKIIAISESTKMDVAEITNVNPSKIEVLHLGVDAPVVCRNKTTTKQLSETPYFLFVGNPEPRRGVEGLIEAFDVFVKENPKYKLVIVGKETKYQRCMIEKVQSMGLPDKVVFTGFISDDNVAEFYRNAVGFIYPSIYEGFGLTILEAMSFGCPVITTNVSSIPEVTGDAALLVTPNQTEELIKAMASLATDSVLREEMIKKGYENVKRFRWEFFVQGVLNVIKETGSGLKK